MNNLLSYCGLVAARISASDKDLPVNRTKFKASKIRKIFVLKLNVIFTTDHRKLSSSIVIKKLIT